MHQLVTTFEEHVQILAVEAPHALILESWRKVSLSLDEYRKGLGKRIKAKELERYIESNPSLGPEVVTKIAELRQRRNEVAHRYVGTVLPEEAVRYANDALELIWDLGLPGWRSRRFEETV